MSLQPRKCEALCITNKCSSIHFTYQCSNYPLEWSESIRYLGVVINSRLTRSDHCKTVCSKAAGLLNLLRRKLYCCSSVAKPWAYTALILLVFQYSCQVWLPHYKKDIFSLELVQKRAVHWVCKVSLIRHVILEALHLMFTSLDLVDHLLWLVVLFPVYCSFLIYITTDYFNFNTSSTKSHSMTLICKQSVVNAYHYSFLLILYLLGTHYLPFVSVLSRSVFHSSVYKFLSVDS